MLQRIDLCRFQAKQTFTLATKAETKASSKWNSRMKMRKPMTAKKKPPFTVLQEYVTVEV